MIKVSIVGREAVIAALKQKKQKLMPAIMSTMQSQADYLTKYVKSNKLSGQVLKQRSGKLKSSIKNNVTQSGELVTAAVYTNTEYAAIHEYGGTIPATQIIAKTAKALAFLWKGKQVFFKKVNRPAVHMPERSFMRSALADNEERIIRALKSTVKKVFES